MTAAKTDARLCMIPYFFVYNPEAVCVKQSNSATARPGHFLCGSAVKESYSCVWVLWWEVHLFALDTSASNIAAGAFSSLASSCLCFSFVRIVRICHSTSPVLSWFVTGFLEVQVKSQTIICLIIFSWLSEGLCETAFLNV